MRSAAGGWSRRGPLCSCEREAAGSPAPRPPRARLRGFIFNEESLLPSRTPPRLHPTSLGSGRGGSPLLGLAASLWSSGSVSPPLPGSDGFFLSFCPRAQRHKPLPRTRARIGAGARERARARTRTNAHSPLTSSVRSAMKPSAPLCPQEPLSRAWGAPGVLSTARDRNPWGVQPAAPWAHWHLPGTHCMPCPALQEYRGPGEGSTLPKEEARGGGSYIPDPCCGLVLLLPQAQRCAAAWLAETEGPGGLGLGIEGHRLSSGPGLGCSPHPPVGPSSTASGSVK